MNLGFVSAIVPELSLEQVLAFAREENFACVEVMCWPIGKAVSKLFGDIPSRNFGLNFDPSHFVLQFMEPASALREFKDKLFHSCPREGRENPPRAAQ